MKNYIVKGSFVILVIWLLTFIFMYIIPSNYQNEFGGRDSFGSHSSDSAQIMQSIHNLLADLQTLKKSNLELKRLLAKDIGGSHVGGLVSLEGGLGGEPSAAYEKIRRDLELDIKEMWYNVKNKDMSEADKAQIHDLYKLLRSYMVKLRASDGYETSREQETEDLSRLVQERLKSLQNPSNCDTAKKLVCGLNKGCGFGCQIHHLCYCMVTVYALGRTMILESVGWRYNRQGWEQVFMPLSDTCKSIGNTPKIDWSAKAAEKAQVVALPIVDFLKPKPAFLPISIPADIADRIERVHGEPHIWWVGQIRKYLLRPQPSIQSMLDETKLKLGVSSPTVGIHVRRTDKIGTEASLHSLQEYMVHAEEFFDIYEKTHGPVRRRVFVASDEPSVITEAMNSYQPPQWEIMADKNVAQSASMAVRYNNAGLNGILKDIFMLAECDFVVCTFSSQVCRMAYEIMQTKHADASDRFISLDDAYYYGGGSGYIETANFAHEPRNGDEIELQVGDQIGVAGNHWNGISKGTNLRTGQRGLYPSYKAKGTYQRANFPKDDVKWW